MIKSITKPGIYVCIVYYPLIEKTSYGTVEYRCPLCRNYLMKKRTRGKQSYDFYHCLDPRCRYLYEPTKVARVMELAWRMVSPDDPTASGSAGRID